MMAHKPLSPTVGAVSSGALIGVFIVLVIGLAVTPVILDFVNEPNTRANLTTSQLAMWDLIPLFWVIGLLVSTVLAVLIISRGTGGGV